MNSALLTAEERQQLLSLARRAVQAAAERREPPVITPEAFSSRLFQQGASFVTLTEADGELRGCIGALEAYRPLVEDVCEHAAAAAVHDFRFPPVAPYEVPGLQIEISRLGAPQPLAYSGPADLLARLRPGVDGVILRDGLRRATFLPQVWEKVSNAEEFLSHLCMKMGAPASLWRRKKLDVQIYQVEEFHE
jgi:AmmeMemoRadiSam system protein A